MTTKKSWAWRRTDVSHERERNRRGPRPGPEKHTTPTSDMDRSLASVLIGADPTISIPLFTVEGMLVYRPWSGHCGQNHFFVCKVKTPSMIDAVKSQPFDHFSSNGCHKDSVTCSYDVRVCASCPRHDRFMYGVRLPVSSGTAKPWCSSPKR